MYIHRANRTPKDFIYQNKGSKCIKSFRPFNRRRRLDRGSSYNTFFENDDDKTFKDTETELEFDLNPELKSFTCVIRNFDLDDSKSNCSISFLNFKTTLK